MLSEAKHLKLATSNNRLSGLCPPTNYTGNL